MKTRATPGRRGVFAGWILLLGLVLLLSSCLRWILEEPSFTLRQVTLSPRSFTEMDILLGIEVRNPNRFDLTLKSFEYTVQLDQQDIGAGRLEKEIVVPASSTSMIHVPVAATFKNLGASLKTVLFSDNVPYKIEGKAGIRAVFGQASFSFSKEGRLNAKDS
jgi:LEA14-like dessication related protein